MSITAPKLAGIHSQLAFQVPVFGWKLLRHCLQVCLCYADEFAGNESIQ
jgi:hypothetical protein